MTYATLTEPGAPYFGQADTLDRVLEHGAPTVEQSADEIARRNAIAFRALTGGGRV